MDQPEKLTGSQIRLPDGLRAWIKTKALENRRSFNSEVIVLLEQVREQAEACKQGEQPDSQKVKPQQGESC